MSKPQTERLGVAALEYFFSQHGWLFREQTTHDYGIDAHLEIVETGRPTGKLIALQIKSGASFFKEESKECFVFRTDDKHVAYWVGHSMPVVLVLFNPDTKQAYWQEISRQTVQSTGKQWRLDVPKNGMFEDPAVTLRRLSSLTQPEPYTRRLNRLRVDRRWMDLIQAGVEVRIEFDDWVNKSLPRYQVTIFTDDEREAWPTLYAPGVGIESMLEHFFPWAEYEVDQDAQMEAAEEEWAEECYSWKDSETGENFYSQTFDEWYESRNGLVPISENGETATYRLVHSLNDFGKSFLEIDSYLSDSEAPENIGFTLE
jgi:Domain of unknown function (DUF4365)